MATNVERLRAIADGLLNRSATAAQITRVSRAVLYRWGRELAEFDASDDNEHKAGLVLNRMREFFLEALREFESREAVEAAKQAAHDGVDSEFAD